MTDLQQKVTNIIKCPICLDFLKAPKSLKCNHVFCNQCLLNLKTENKKKCPVCRSKIKSFDKLKTSSEIKNLLKIVKLDNNTVFIDSQSNKVEDLILKFEDLMTGGGSRQRTGSASPAENPKQRDPKEIEKMVDEYEGPNAKKTPPVPVPTVPKRLASLQKKNLAKSMKKSNIGKYKVIKPNLKAPKQSKPKNSVEIPLAGEIPIAGTMPATTVAKRPAPQPPKATKASKPAKSTKPAKASKVTFQDKKKDINQPMKPQKLKKQDKKVFKDELTLDSEETSEDEGTTRDVDTNELESSSQASGESSEISESTDDESGSDETSDSEEGKSDESDSELDESESDSASDSDSQEDDEDEDDADSEDEDDEEEGEREPTEEEIIYRQGKKVAIFPDDSSFRKTHGKGVVKHKVELPGIIGYVYGIELNKGVTSRGLNLRLTKKQEKCLSQNMKSWWMLNKSSHCWVEGYRMCDGKLV